MTTRTKPKAPKAVKAWAIVLEDGKFMRVGFGIGFGIDAPMLWSRRPRGAIAIPVTITPIPAKRRKK